MWGPPAILSSVAVCPQAVVSVQRAGEQLQGKLGAVVLQAGDLLLMDVASGFDEHSSAVVDNLVGEPLHNACVCVQFCFRSELWHATKQQYAVGRRRRCLP